MPKNIPQSGDYMNSIEFNKLLRGDNLDHLSIFKVQNPSSIKYNSKNPDSLLRKSLVNYVNKPSYSKLRKSVKRRDIQSIQRKNSIRQRQSFKKTSPPRAAPQRASNIPFIFKGKPNYVIVDERRTYTDLLKFLFKGDTNKEIFILNSLGIAINKITKMNEKITQNILWIQDTNRATIDPVGPRQSFNCPPGYSGWRFIRGDGDCYYRSVIFGIIEQFIQNPRIRKQGFQLLFKKFNEITRYMNKELALSHGDLMRKIQQAIESKTWQNLQNFEADVIQNIDIPLIRACRLFLSNYLKTNKSINGIDIKQAIESEKPFAEYIKDVETMGIYAYGLCIDAAILPLSLNFMQNIVDPVNKYTQESQRIQTPFGVIDLYYHDEHYDLLYR